MNKRQCGKASHQHEHILTDAFRQTAGDAVSELPIQVFFLHFAHMQLVTNSSFGQFCLQVMLKFLVDVAGAVLFIEVPHVLLNQGLPEALEGHTEKTKMAQNATCAFPDSDVAS